MEKELHGKYEFKEHQKRMLKSPLMKSIELDILCRADLWANGIGQVY